jgi:hypothetical protein
MKKLLIGVLFILASALGYSQTYPETFSNGESYASIRSKLNFNATATADSLDEHLDSLWAHNIKIIALDARVASLESGATGYVPTSRTVNGHALTGDISVTASDVGLGNVTNESKATMFASPVFTGRPTVPGYVPTSTTVNGHALSGNVSVTAADVGLGNVTNESKATMFADAALTGIPTAPTATASTSTTQIATTAFSQAAIAAALADLAVGVQILVSEEELISGEASGYIFDIPDMLDGMNLVKVEAFPGETEGDHTIAVVVWRNRSGSEVNMTSTGASFSADAIINTSYDDVANRDQLEIRWTYSGGTTAPVALKVQLTFQNP